MADARSFSDDLRRFALAVEAEHARLTSAIVFAVHESVTVGHAVTASPGQPVQTGALRDSWQTEWEGPTSAFIWTDKPYAPSIEDGVSYAHGGTPMQLRSAVGGFHSVKLTVAGFPQLVEFVVRKAA